jgi:uncharacterized cupredoxin-like copper-binding protein
MDSDDVASEPASHRLALGMKKYTISAAAIIMLAGVNLPCLAHDHNQSAIGKPGDGKQVNRTVAVEMTDAMRFVPGAIAVRKGETIRFIVHNGGKLKHEFVLGTTKALKEHAELMKKFPGMEHFESHMTTVAPDQTGEVIWQFTKAGTVYFACLQPGHYEAGMKGSVNVDAAKAK